MTKLTDDERKRALDRIHDTADYLHQVARRFDGLRHRADQDSASDEFLHVVIAAGRLAEQNLAQTGDLLEILFSLKETGGDS